MAILGPLYRPLRAIRSYLPPPNFITLHYAYFITTCLISAVIFWGLSTPARSVSFTDSLFLTVSAMTLAGLNTINLSTTNTAQQILLFALIMVGSAIWVSAFVVHLRRRAFEKRFKVIAESRRSRWRQRSTSRQRRYSCSRKTVPDDMVPDEKYACYDTTSEHENTNSQETDDPPQDSTPPPRRGRHEMNDVSSATEPLHALDSPDPSGSLPINIAITPGITFGNGTRFTSTEQPARRRRGSFLNMQGVGARPTASLDSRTPGPVATSTNNPDNTTYVPESQGNIGRYLDSATGWISRNSEFHGLTAQEREKLGGYEYRAVSLLAWLVPAYYILWQLLGALGCAAWIARNRPDTAYTNGLNPWWVGAFNAVSAFNNSGMSLLDANMTAFQTSYYLLLTMGLLILAGNTCYPLFLRLIVWTMYKIASNIPGEKWSTRTKTLRFLLDHPRRCYTNLFPAQHTWWLLLSVVTLNSVDWAAFEILNINNTLLDSTLPTNIRIIDGLFQASAVRSGGFYVVTVSNLRISLLVLYVVMMYISVYPVVITMRNSNVYEERSLGIYADDPEQSPVRPPAQQDERTSGNIRSILRRAATAAEHLVARGVSSRDSNAQFVRQQLQAQLAHDAWWIVLALFLIMIIENQKFVDDPVNFSVFNFLFEIVSAYGCVGISVGVPYDAYSFCGAWQTLSKLILCAVMLRGRHRGLPVAIDKAVLLPGEEHWETEEDDGRIRIARTISRGRQGTV